MIYFNYLRNCCLSLFERDLNKNPIAKASSYLKEFVISTYFTQKFLFRQSDAKLALKKLTFIQNQWRIKKSQPSSVKRFFFSKKVNQMALKNDREGLKALAYNLFNEQIPIRNCIADDFLKIHSSNAHLLMQMFEDQQADISDLSVILLNTFDEYQEFQISEYASYANTPQIKAYVEKLASQERISWPDYVKNVDPESIVEISHGGGYRYISDFILGTNHGYKLERGGTGLQVSPVKTDRDEFYSLRSCVRFDTPAILKAKIKAKYLDAAPNEYEAGLRPQYIQYLTDIKVEKWNPSSKQICGQSPSYIHWDKINKTYSPNKAIRFKASVDNLKKKHGWIYN